MHEPCKLETRMIFHRYKGRAKFLVENACTPIYACALSYICKKDFLVIVHA